VGSPLIFLILSTLRANGCRGLKLDSRCGDRGDCATPDGTLGDGGCVDVIRL